METDSDRRQSVIRSFSFKCLVTPREVYLVGPAESMMAFFGTTEDSYRNGMISRIRKDISSESADTIIKLITEKSSSGEDFRLIYPSKRADGSDCVIQMDGYAKEKTDDGRYYDVIDLDVTELHEAKEKADKLAKVNGMLLEDSPVGSVFTI